MALGIAELVILGLIVEWVFRKFKLPGLIGLLLLGVALGKSALGLLGQGVLSASADLRLIALVVILLRAGFEISREALAKVGLRAGLLAFIPCCLEIGVITLSAPWLLGFSYLEGAILGGVLAAVSPAVVVPLMVKFIKEKRGADKSIPTLVLAGASVDDAVAIVLCTSFLGMYVGAGQSAQSAQQSSLGANLISVPISVVTGILVGFAVGVVLYKIFDRFNPRATKRVLMLIAIAILLEHFKGVIDQLGVPFAPLIAIMAIGFIILEKREHAAHEISAKLGKIWIFAQLLLFTLVGAAVDVNVAIKAGLVGAAIIAIGLLGRTLGVQLCLIKSNLTKSERAFVSISYLPKATVQAVMGAVPLLAMQKAKMNEAPGQVILAIAVLSILLTAPLGAFAISFAGKRILTQGTAEDYPQLKAVEESND